MYVRCHRYPCEWFVKAGLLASVFAVVVVTDAATTITIAPPTQSSHHQHPNLID